MPEPGERSDSCEHPSRPWDSVCLAGRPRRSLCVFFLSPSSWYLQPARGPAAVGSATGPGTGTGLTGFATLMSGRALGRAGLRRQCCPVLASPPPIPASPLCRGPTPLSRGAAWETGKRKPLRRPFLALSIVQHGPWTSLPSRTSPSSSAQGGFGLSHPQAAAYGDSS